jgi:hypothetical protein
MKIGALVFNGARRDCGLTSAETKVERGKAFGLPFGVSAPPWSSPLGILTLLLCRLCCFLVY